MTDDNKQNRGLLFMEGIPSENHEADDANLPEPVEPAQDGEVVLQQEPIEVSDFELADIIEERLSSLMRVSGNDWYIATDHGWKRDADK